MPRAGTPHTWAAPIPQPNVGLHGLIHSPSPATVLVGYADRVRVRELHRPPNATSFVSVTAASPPRGRLVAPVPVRVGDDLVRRWGAPRGLVVRGVRVSHEGDVVAADEGPVDRGAYAGVGLRARDDEMADPRLGEDPLQLGGLEGVAVVLVDERLGVLARLLDVDHQQGGTGSCRSSTGGGR